MLTIIIDALKETITMVFLSGLVTMGLGIPLGMLLYGTKNKQFFANRLLHNLLQWPTTFINAVPYIVVAILCIPLSRWLVDHGVSSSVAAVIPLTLATVPFYGLLTYAALEKLPTEFGDTAKSLGATPWQALNHMYLPEIFPGLIHDFITVLKYLIGYSTISGIFGAGGLGYVLLQKGYYSFDLLYITICAMLLVLLFQFIQYIGILLSAQATKA